VITRFAPTPSGYLHIGNAANALLVAWLAAACDGTVVLRIDDMDAPRARPEYVDDIFSVLDWLGIVDLAGPRSADEFTAVHSSRHRMDAYRRAVEELQGSRLEVYACACSRSSLTGPASGGCPGHCRSRGLEYVHGQTALRVHVPLGTTVDVDGFGVDLAASMGDFVVWRRDDLPAYQLASLVDDEALGITHIVRGRDLLPSTAAQRFLAGGLGASGFQHATVVHHELVTDPGGGKLSKSQAGSGVPLNRSAATRRLVHETARSLGSTVGISPPA
jgi:glutamyl-tRNA synthetase